MWNIVSSKGGALSEIGDPIWMVRRSKGVKRSDSGAHIETHVSYFSVIFCLLVRSEVRLQWGETTVLLLVWDCFD